jgi:hypothetical protein
MASSLSRTVKVDGNFTTKTRSKRSKNDLNHGLTQMDTDRKGKKEENGMKNFPIE